MSSLEEKQREFLQVKSVPIQLLYTHGVKSLKALGLPVDEYIADLDVVLATLNANVVPAKSEIAKALSTYESIAGMMMNDWIKGFMNIQNCQIHEEYLEDIDPRVQRRADAYVKAMDHRQSKPGAGFDGVKSVSGTGTGTIHYGNC